MRRPYIYSASVRSEIRVCRVWLEKILFQTVRISATLYICERAPAKVYLLLLYRTAC